MSKILDREIAGLELMLGQELPEDKKKRAEEKLERLRGQASQSMEDTVVMTAVEKAGHTPHRFHRPTTKRSSH